MKWTTRIANAVGLAARRRVPSVGRLLEPRGVDTVRDYPSDGLTPRRLVSILREADSGAPGQAMQLFEEMEEEDAHLFAVAGNRRLGLTGLEWSVVSAADRLEGVDRAFADEVAAYCRVVLSRIESMDEVLQHLSLAIGRNIAMAELVWGVRDGAVTVCDIVPVDFGRIVFDELDQPLVLMGDSDRAGQPLSPNKFIVHTPHSVSGHPARGGLLRATALVFLAKNLAMKDWMIFAELFGMPVRVGRYEPTATAEEKRELLDMLESLGSRSAGIFSRAVQLELVEAGRGKTPPPYENLLGFLNREMSKAWLGQTLTTEAQGASLAASRIHDEVRRDLRVDDIRKEGRTIRRDLLAPLARFRFGPEAPVPFFTRHLDGPRDVRELTAVLDAAVNRLGMRVPADYAHQALGVPQADAGEAVVSGALDAGAVAGGE